jgi:hypothetical protein
METLATWSPAPYLNVTAVEREGSRWLVMVYSRERACCPVCGVQSRSRHSFYSRTLGDLSAQGTPVASGVAHTHAQPSHQSRGGPPTRAMTEQPDDFRQAVGLTRRRSYKSRKTFGEDLAATPLVPAAPATHAHPDGAPPCCGSAGRSHGIQNGRMAHATS